jgi:3-oxoacyl-(acyl-carrier-protein) synthase
LSDHLAHESEPIVITGIGMITSVGNDRESSWQAIRQGQSGVRSLDGLPNIPDGLLQGAPVVGLEPTVPNELKVITLTQRATSEALQDAGIDLDRIDLSRFACAISGHMGDTSPLETDPVGSGVPIPADGLPWFQQWLPNSACSIVANRLGLTGPRICHSVACASGLIDILSAVRSIRDQQCDIALCGSAEAFHPLFAAGFHQMRVLAHHEDPTQACRPFDRGRHGFVMGEGAAMFVIERLSHAQRRQARIYAEIAGGKMLAEAHHVTDLDAESQALEYLIRVTLQQAELEPRQIGYINAHGTGTQQNDPVETRGIRRAFGASADDVSVSATKSMVGHLVNAAGSVELAVTALALRDEFVPPTINLTDPDPECDLDCIPLVGRPQRMDHALKLSVAFGGHLAAVALRRWDDPDSGFVRPARPAA